MAHYFTNENLPSKENTIKVIVKNKNYTFKTDNGVFSKKGLDFGTRTLLESLPDVKGKILDLGCGWGPIGIILADKNDIDMVDINERSLALTRKNAIINNKKVNIFKSDIYENIKDNYDYIITNPPIRVGKEILNKFLFEAKDHLKENGQLWFVIHKEQGAKSMFKKICETYDAQIVCKNKGFYIIKAIKID